MLHNYCKDFAVPKNNQEISFMQELASKLFLRPSLYLLVVDKNESKWYTFILDELNIDQGEREKNLKFKNMGL